MGSLAVDTSQLERFVLSNDRKAAVTECFLPGTVARAFFDVVEAILHKDFKSASALLNDQDGLLMGVDKKQELEAFMHLQMWDESGAEEQCRKLQQYLMEKLRLNFAQYPNYVPSTPEDADEFQQVGDPVYPCAITEEEYSMDKFMGKLDVTQLLSNTRWFALAHGMFSSAPHDVQLQILKAHGTVAAQFPGVEDVLLKWLEASLEEAGAWLQGNLCWLSAEQVQTLANRSPPRAKSDPRFTRALQCALVKKLYPADDWTMVQFDPERVAAMLTNMDQLCKDLGDSANWIRVQVLASQLQLLQKQGHPLPIPLLLDFLQLARKISWMSPPVVTLEPNGLEVHHGVHCDMCQQNPIQGVRYKSQNLHNYDVCSRCYPNAANAAPFTVISGSTCHAYIFLDDDPTYSLGPAVGMPSGSPSGAESLLHAVAGWLKAMVMHNGEDFIRGVSPLAAFIAPEVYNKTVAEALLLNGKAIDEQHWIRMYEAAHGNARQLAELQVLEFLPSSKTHYGVAEPISLQLGVKNIPSVLVKVYEINAWNYYTHEKKELDPSLQLVGVSATSEKTFTFNSSPMKREVLSWQLLEGRRGIFVVDVMGAGLTRRAIIHKGHLRYLERLGSAGHELQVFYEDWSVVPKARAWLEGRTYEAGASGEIFIPYASSNSDLNMYNNAYPKMDSCLPLVLGDVEGAASLHNFSRKEEQYQLRFDAYVDAECIHPHEDVPLVVNTSLHTHGYEPAPLELVEDVALVIEMEGVGGATSTKAVPGFQLRNHPQVLHIRVQEQCRRIMVRLKGRVGLVAPGENGEKRYQDMDVVKSFDVDTSEETDVIWDAHLLGQPDGTWAIQVLGRAGELPREPIRFQVELRTALTGSCSELGFEVQTNATGAVKLGRLKNIQTLSVRPPGRKQGTAHKAGGNEGHTNEADLNVKRNWSLQPARSDPNMGHMNAPGIPSHQWNIPVLVGASSAPIKLTRHAHLFVNQVFLWSVNLPAAQDRNSQSLGGVISNVTQRHVRVEDGSLIVSGLLPGVYHLVDLDGACMHVLNVVETSIPPEHPAWQFNTIPAKHYAPPCCTPANLSITSAEASTTDGLKVKVEGALGAVVRLVVVFKRFMPLADEMWKLQLGWSRDEIESKGQSSDRIKNFPPSASAYLQGSPLSAALQYVLCRRQLSTVPRPGNMLDLPSLLSSPHKVGSTTTINQTLPSQVHAPQYGTTLQESLDTITMPNAFLTCMNAPRMGRSDRMVGVSYSHLSQARYMAPLACYRGTPFLQFCPAAAVVGPLVVGGQDQVALSPEMLKEMGVDLMGSGSTLAMVVACREEDGVACTAVCTVKGALGTIAAPVRDLGLSKHAESGRQYKPVWDACPLQPGGELLIEDIASAKLAVYDSMSKAMDLLVAALKPHGKWDLLQQHFSFLPDWTRLSLSQKLKHLEQRSCTELRFFIYCKDPDFFSSIILPGIHNKLKSERSFLDWWFLRDPEMVSHWSVPHRFVYLNALEKILLAALVSPAELSLLVRDWKLQLDPGRGAHNVAKRQQQRNKLIQLAIEAIGPADNTPSEPGTGAQPTSRDEENIRSDRFLHDVNPFSMHDMDDGALFRDGAATASCFGFATEAEPEPVAVPHSAGPQLFGMMAAPRSMTEKANAAMQQRQQQQQQQSVLFKEKVVVQMWGETSYYNIEPVQESSAEIMSELISVNEFWLDYAEWLAGGSQGTFVSANFTQAATTLTEAIMALAVTGLPFTTGSAAYRMVHQGAGMSLAAASPCIVFHHQRKPASTSASLSRSVLVSQVLLDPRDSQTEDPATGEMMQKAVEPPLKVGRVYNYTVVITNMSPNELLLDVVIQVPQGALQLLGSSQSTQVCTLPPYTGTQFSLSFYFPQPGTFIQHPCSVLRQGQLVWTPEVPLSPLEVLPSLPPAPVDPTRDLKDFDWSKFVANANNDDMLQFLKGGDISKATLQDIAGRCHNRDFFLQATSCLRARHAFDPTIWQFSVQHMDEAALREYLPTSHLKDMLGKLVVDSPLMKVEARERGYRHLEFWPVVHRLAHPMPTQGSWTGQPLGSQLLEDNETIRKHWHDFLFFLACKPALEPLDVLELSQYLILQARLDEAEQLLAGYFTPEATVKLGTACEMQVDYMRAWLNVSSVNPDLGVAREVDDKYRSGACNPFWSARFQELHDMLEELDAIAAGRVYDNAHRPESKKGEVAEAMLLLKGGITADGLLHVSIRNISEIQVHMYEIDVELLFTSQPFGQATSGMNSSSASSQGLGKVSYVKPRRSWSIPVNQPATVEADGEEMETDLPTKEVTAPLQVGALLSEAGLSNSSVMVELCAAGLTRSVLRFASNIHVDLLEKQGIIQVLDATTHLPLSAAYVKVFGRASPSAAPSLYKDGYTDRRGKFNYATIAAGVGDEAPTEFALLVVSDSHGALILEAAAAT